MCSSDLRGTRLFQLGLDSLALAIFAASSPEHQSTIDAVLEENTGQDFASGFLAASGFTSEANEIADRHKEICNANRATVQTN